MTQKTALITGASRGIGAAVARKLAAEGYAVSLAARSADQMHELVASLTSAGHKAIATPIDLTQTEAPAAVLEATLKAFGRLDVIVCNAGTAQHKDFLSCTDTDWANGFDLKFFGHVRLLRAAWKELEKTKGNIVMIAGAASRTPPAGYAIGSTVNSAILALTKSLADFGRHCGIRVNAINPAQIRTDRLDGRIAKIMKDEKLDRAAAEQKLVRQSGIVRIGEPKDIAELVAFMAGEVGSYLHGSIVDMDGGMTRGL
ncbi:MAG TPA: SDR family oxidoreductase [Stellaceae bacterium]|jgi:3-oxoacyl-[acyl-carrier protein] reductase|nr:SDR family oxidoreductase [Stellaceae bacterium]